jgi:carbonic anhydrase
VEVRRVRTDRDLQGLHARLLEYEASLPPDLRHGLVGNLQAVRSAFGEPNAAFLAIDGTDAAGCIGVTKLDASTAVMMRLFVRDNYRGRGIARSLVAEALTFLRESGHRRVVLDTDKERLRAAYELYGSLGFSECEPYGPVDYASPTFMELRLR